MESDGSFAASVSRLLASGKARCTASYEYLRSETDASGGGGVMPSFSRGSRSAEARRSSCSLAAAEGAARARTLDALGRRLLSGGGAGEAAPLVHLQLADHVGGGGVAAGDALAEVVGALLRASKAAKGRRALGRADESLEALGDRAYVERVRRLPPHNLARAARRRRRLRIVILGAAALATASGT